MDGTIILDSGDGRGAEVWKAAPNVRWKAPNKSDEKIPSTWTLQQAWYSNYGKVEWIDVPVVSLSPQETP